MKPHVSRWWEMAGQFLTQICKDDGAPSVPGGPVTLYGSAYTFMGLYYLGRDTSNISKALNILALASQDADTGIFFGPELVGFVSSDNSKHDREHLSLHLTCSAVLPVAQQLKMAIRPVRIAQEYCDAKNLAEWTSAINWKHAWFEGNNILFVGQLLVYLRDVERHPHASEALRYWFEWLDREADPATGLWGTNGYCSPMEAVYGGYHQLLVYYYENHPLPNLRGLVDTVLELQHGDGGFNPEGNGGACEDVDCVDILVNAYKRSSYRQTEIRVALRRCLKHILSTQNPDGGFPYNRDRPQSHMGIPGTQAPANTSCTFPTWFRIHTLALIAEVLPDEPEFDGITFRFNEVLSMGWHRSPAGWKYAEPVLGQQIAETLISSRRIAQSYWQRSRGLPQLIRRKIGNLKRRLARTRRKSSP